MQDSNQNNNQVLPQQASSSDALKTIAEGNIAKLKIPENAVVLGKKLRNEVLTGLAYNLLEDRKMPAEEVLKLVLLLDEMVEKEVLTSEVLKTIEKNPGFFQNYLNKLAENR